MTKLKEIIQYKGSTRNSKKTTTTWKVSTLSAAESQQNLLVLPHTCDAGEIIAASPKRSKGVYTVRISVTGFTLSNFAQGAAISVASSYRKIARVAQVTQSGFVLVFREGTNESDCARTVNDFRRYWGIRLNNSTATQPNKSSGRRNGHTRNGKKVPCAPNNPFRSNW